MQFRIRGDQVRIIRMVKDPQTGKSKVERIGSLHRGKMGIGERLRAASTEAELAQIQSWIERQRALRHLKAEYAAETLAEQVAFAAQWLRTVDPGETRELVAEIRAAWLSLRKAMNRGTRGRVAGKARV